MRELLPGRSPGLVVITSRRSLAGLENLRRLVLEPMWSADAADLLAAIAGPRATADEAAIAEVSELCGNLPLALRIAGSRLLSRPGWTARYMASRLGDARRRLANLTAGDLAVSAAFRLSYDQLNDQGRRLFRRLSLVPGDDAGPALAAVLAECTPAEAEDGLEELADLGLLLPAAAGDHARVVEVAEALHRFSNHWVSWRHWEAVFTMPVAAARDLGDLALQATQLNHLAWSQAACYRRYQRCVDHA